MQIKDLYQKYAPLPSLQQHMLRVAGIVSILLANLKDNAITATGFTKQELIIIALLHDIAKLVEVDLKQTAKIFPELTKKQLKDLELAQKRLQKQLGQNHSCGAGEIFDKLHLPARFAAAEGLIRFKYLGFIYNNQILPNYILNYADLRVTPYEVTNLTARFLEGQKRFLEKHHGLKSSVDFDTLYTQAKQSKLRELPDNVFANEWTKQQFNNMLKIEDYIFAQMVHTNLKPEDITEERVQQEIKKQSFLDWEVKPYF